MKFARYIGISDQVTKKNDKLATHGDILEVHAKTNDDEGYVVKGNRSDLYFVVSGSRLQFFEEV
jgi:cell division protein FtsB